MNWQAIGFDWNQARSFLATAREGSLSAAARALQTTQPTIGRHIDALEAELEVLLFERGRRGLTLTAAGREVLEQVEAMAVAAGRISLISAGQAREVEGEVSVTAVDFVCQRVVVPAAARLADEAPGLSVRVLACDALRDLSRREADIAIRHVRPTQGDLVVRLAANWHAGFWASRALLDRLGRPTSPVDMQRYPVVGTEDPERFMALARDLGVPLEARSSATRSTAAWWSWTWWPPGSACRFCPTRSVGRGRTWSAWAATSFPPSRSRCGS